MLSVYLLFAAQLSAKPPHRVGHAAVVDGDRLYVFGGFEVGSSSPSRRVVSTSFRNGALIDHGQLSQPRGFCTVAQVNRKVYVVGGIVSSTEASSRVDVFDLDTKKWSLAPEFPYPVSRAAAIALGSRVVVIGGIAGNDRSGKNSSAVWILEPGVASWIRGKDLPLALHGHSAVTTGSVAYVAGGYEGEGMKQSAAVYSGNGRDGWSRAPSMPTPRSFFSMVYHGGRIFVFGNRGEVSHPASWKIGDSAWHNLPIADTGRHRAATIVVNNSVWILGGEGANTPSEQFKLN